MNKVLIRPVPSHTVRNAAKAANAARRAQSAQRRYESDNPVLGPPAPAAAPKSGTTDILAELHKFAGKVQEVHTAQVMSLVREMDNTDIGGVTAYNVAKATFPTMPAYSAWVREAV